MLYDCKRDAPINGDFFGFSTREDLIFHRDLYMAPRGKILAEYAAGLCREEAGRYADAEMEIGTDAETEIGDEADAGAKAETETDAGAGRFFEKGVPAESIYRATFPGFGISAAVGKAAAKIRDAAGGYFAHQCFFESLGDGKICALSMMKIHGSFGSADSFFRRFIYAAKSARGNGFLWVCEQKLQKDKLFIVFTKNNVLPPPHLKPLLCLDLWDHALRLSRCGTKSDYAAAFLKNADFTKLI